MKKVDIPEDLKLENYERRIQQAVFDRLELVVELRGGLNGIGATVKKYKEAIPAHDEIVKMIEEKMEEIEQFKKNYRKKQRLFRNLDSAWNITLDNADEWEEYNLLKPKMRNIEKRIMIVEDQIAKSEMIADYKRFHQLHPKCSRQTAVYESYSEARRVKDIAMKELVDAESQLNKLKLEEKRLAGLISDDHITADEKKQSLNDMFPNVQVGMILRSFNGHKVENKPFREVMEMITKAKSMHRTEWLRYDYRFDPFNQSWLSLAELREMGVVVENPLLQRTNFVNTAAEGRIKELKSLLLRGEDPDSADLSGNTALTMAATNKHSEVVQLLVSCGANVNGRDKNMMTSLLFAINKGYVEIVRQLLDLGADRNASDTNGRGVLYYSILSGNVTLVKMFLKSESCNVKDALWGFTPLHLAANQGNLSLVQFLIKFGCSIYIKDNKGKTAEEVSLEARHIETNQFLKNERQTAAGQVVYVDEHYSTQIWIGDESALNVRFCADADISAILYFRVSERLPPHAGWLKADKYVKFSSYVLDVDDEDRTMESWNQFMEIFPQVITYLIDTIKSKDANILICDSTGDSLSPAVLSLLLIIRYQIRTKESFAMLSEVRPSYKMSVSMQRGLDILQKTQDDKILKRMTDKARTSNVVSIAF